MPYCSNCGTKLNDTDKFCSNCGAPVNEQGQAQQPSVPQQPSETQQTSDSTGPYSNWQSSWDTGNQQSSQDDGKATGCLFGGLSFLSPILGLIFFIIWKDKKPNTARTCGICALVSFVLNLVSVFLMGGLSSLYSLMNLNY